MSIIEDTHENDGEDNCTIVDEIEIAMVQQDTEVSADVVDLEDDTQQEGNDSTEVTADVVDLEDDTQANDSTEMTADDVDLEDDTQD